MSGGFSLNDVGGCRMCWICLKFSILFVLMQSTVLVYLSICVEISSIFLSSSDSSSPVKVCTLRSKNLCMLPYSLFSWPVVLPWKVMTSEAAWTRSGTLSCSFLNSSSRRRHLVTYLVSVLFWNRMRLCTLTASAFILAMFSCISTFSNVIICFFRN